MMLHNRWGHGEVSCYASSVCDTGSSVLESSQVYPGSTDA